MGVADPYHNSNLAQTRASLLRVALTLGQRLTLTLTLSLVLTLTCASP